MTAQLKADHPGPAGALFRFKAGQPHRAGRLGGHFLEKRRPGRRLFEKTREGLPRALGSAGGGHLFEDPVAFFAQRLDFLFQALLPRFRQMDSTKLHAEKEETDRGGRPPDLQHAAVRQDKRLPFDEIDPLNVNAQVFGSHSWALIMNIAPCRRRCCRGAARRPSPRAWPTGPTGSSEWPDSRSSVPSIPGASLRRRTKKSD